MYPDHHGTVVLGQLNVGHQLRIHPFLLTALSYAGSEIITVFDPNLFVISQIPSYSGENLFYHDHAGRITPSLFTIRRNAEMAKVLTMALMNSDYSDIMTLNRFGFVISNGLAFSPQRIVGGQYVFSNPSDHDQIRAHQLVALDFSNIQVSRSIYKDMAEIKKSMMPKVNSISKIKASVKKSINKIEKMFSKELDPVKYGLSTHYRLLFKYSSRSRPDLFRRGLASIFNYSVSRNFLVLCSLDSDDPTLPQYKEAIADFRSENIKVVYGESQNKIDAINRDLNQHTGNWDILINMSDDMVFQEYGFDLIIRQAFGNDLDQFIHFNDGIQFQNLCSMTIEGRLYYHRFNYIYHPKYVSLWCDVEAQDVAKALGRYRYMGDDLCILKHLHPSAGLAEMDEQYKRTEDKAIWSKDHDLYLARKASGFVDSDQPVFVKSSPKLSILILTIDSRLEMFSALLEEFIGQANKYDGQCEILWEIDNGEKTKGEKRNALLDRARGKYLAFFDDDDWPSQKYVSSILSAIKSDPDCCSLLGEMTTNGLNPETFEHSLKYSTWKTNPEGAVKYERNPNHLNPIRSSIAKSIRFPKINHGEDRAWSQALLESGQLKTEAAIPNVIYHYRFVTFK
jgi:Glycosyl transferase family 2